jgi:hypothetical protein
LAKGPAQGRDAPFHAADLPGTKCTFANDRGRWEFATPADVSVELSLAPLSIRCTREGYAEYRDELKCLTAKEVAAQGAFMALQLANPGAAAPAAAGVGVAGILLYVLAAAAIGAATASAVTGPITDMCSYVSGSSFTVEMEVRTAAPGIAAARGAEPETVALIPAAASNPGALPDVLNSGRGTIVYAETSPAGKTSLWRVPLKPSTDVLAVLPQGYRLSPANEILSQRGVRYRPPIPLVAGSLAPGSRWTYSGTVEETHGVGRSPVTSEFQVIGREVVETGAGSFPAIHVREIRWQARSGYRVERWLDEATRFPVREQWLPEGTRWGGSHGTGSFSHFDPPAMEGSIEIRFVSAEP